jgi:hypothetical protein
MRKMRPTVTGGKASTTRNWTTRLIHTNTGMRMRVMPGARMFRMVAMKFTPASIEEAPRTCRPSTQKSTPWLGEYCFEVRLT